jgi:SAM-dependent methyltransferase
MNASQYAETGKKNLEILEDAVFYNACLERLLRHFIAPATAAVDFGAGGGEFARRLRGVKVTCVEPDMEFQARLRADGFEVVEDIRSCKNLERVYSLNVLEHIEDDRAALSGIFQSLAPGGKLLLYVPAFMQIYNEIDRRVGHYRRYTKKTLLPLLRNAGFEIEEARYVDSAGFFSWWLLKYIGGGGGEINRVMVIFYDRVCFPISLLGDFVFNRWFGKNLLVVAKRPA